MEFNKVRGRQKLVEEYMDLVDGGAASRIRFSEQEKHHAQPLGFYFYQIQRALRDKN